MLMWMLQLGCGVALLAGAVLLIVGLRGRRVDDHPICRKCGFDLFGKPQGSTICSECGADLTRPHAIANGRRVRRGGMLFAGGALLAILLAGGGGAGWIVLNSSDWWEYAPVWYLRNEASGLDPKARDAALTQLATRLGVGKLSQQQIDGLMDQALVVQGDVKQTWVPGWGDLVESANAGGKLSKERWDKYLTQAPNLKLIVRPELRRGDKLPYWIHNQPARVGSKSSISVTHSIKQWTIGPVTHRSEDGSSMGSMLSTTGGGASGSSFDIAKHLDPIPDGPQTMRITFDLTFARGWNAPRMATSTLELSAPLNLHPANEPTAHFNNDPTLRAGVEKALTVSFAEYGQTWNSKYLNLTIMVGGVPVGIGYDVYARFGGAGGREQKIGSFACPKGTNNHGWSCGGDVNPFDDARIDIVLKPSLEAAIASIDTFEVWNGEVVIKDVVVKRMTPASNPTTTTTTTSSK
jgi:hypothetical protein